MHIDALDTPALLIDLDVMERNLQRAADYAKAHGLHLRPHTKTHKTPALARLQLELGAAGLTVAKVGEAEVMAQVSPPGLLVAYPVLGESKLRRLAEVARKTQVTVALDNAVVARGLAEAAAAYGVEFGVLAEWDAGMARAGLQSTEELAALALGISRLPKLRFEGIAFYPGHVQSSGADGEAALAQVRAALDAALDRLSQQGTPAAIVSGGSTPTLYQSHLIPRMNEIRPGTYIFNDRNTVEVGACGPDDCAASILVTVVSTARPGQVLIDGGSKTFSSDRCRRGGFGYVREAPAAVLTNLNEEHGYLDVREVRRTYSVGDRLRIVPNHVCTAVNLHERLYGIRGDRVECEWAVEARGKLQ